MYCPTCGKPISDGSVVCPECHEILQKKRNFHLSNINLGKMNFLGMIGTVLIILSLFLPTVKVSFFGFNQSENIFDLNIWIGILFIFCAVLAIVFFAYQENRLALYCGISELILSVFVYIGIRYEIKNASSAFINMADITKIGIGMYLLFIGGFITILAARFYKK